MKLQSIYKMLCNLLYIGLKLIDNFAKIVLFMIIFIVFMLFILNFVKDVKYNIYINLANEMKYFFAFLTIVFLTMVENKSKYVRCCIFKIKLLFNNAISLIYVVLNCIKTKIIISFAVVVFVMYIFTHYYLIKVERENVSSICRAESKILTREEILYRAVLDSIRVHYERHDRENRLSLWRGFGQIDDNLLISNCTMTSEELEKRLQNVYMYCGLTQSEDDICRRKILQIGFEPIGAVDRISGNIKNGAVVVYYNNIIGGLNVYFPKNQSVMSESEAILDGMKLPIEEASVYTDYCPECAKKKGYANFYYKETGYYYSFKKNKYLKIYSRYYPLSNCGDIYRIYKKNCPEEDGCDTIFF